MEYLCKLGQIPEKADLSPHVVLSVTISVNYLIHDSYSLLLEFEKLLVFWRVFESIPLGVRCSSLSFPVPC